MRDSCEFGFFKKKFNCLITARRHGSSGRVSASQAGKDLSTAKKKKKKASRKSMLLKWRHKSYSTDFMQGYLIKQV
jgi:hypothetical protein